MERAHEPDRVPRAVEEIRIAERDVRRAVLDLPADVLEHGGLRHDEEAAFVHRDDRAVTAEMQTAAARLDVPGEALAAVIDDARVARERRQRRAARHRKR